MRRREEETARKKIRERDREKSGETNKRNEKGGKERKNKKQTDKLTNRKMEGINEELRRAEIVGIGRGGAI